jgi:hypothetical protein
MRSVGRQILDLINVGIIVDSLTKEALTSHVSGRMSIWHGWEAVDNPYRIKLSWIDIWVNELPCTRGVQEDGLRLLLLDTVMSGILKTFDDRFVGLDVLFRPSKRSKLSNSSGLTWTKGSLGGKKKTYVTVSGGDDDIVLWCLLSEDVGVLERSYRREGKERRWPKGRKRSNRVPASLAAIGTILRSMASPFLKDWTRRDEARRTLDSGDVLPECFELLDVAFWTCSVLDGDGRVRVLGNKLMKDLATDLSRYGRKYGAKISERW